MKYDKFSAALRHSRHGKRIKTLHSWSCVELQTRSTKRRAVGFFFRSPAIIRHSVGVLEENSVFFGNLPYSGT